MTDIFNIASALPEMAANKAYQPAVVFPTGRDAQGRAQTVQYSFGQLNTQVDQYAHGLTAAGFTKGIRVLLLLNPGPELITIVFALLKLGAVPVLIDPGMGRKAFLRCVQDAQPEAMIGLPVAHALRRLVPKAFKSIETSVVTNNMRVLADHTLSDIRADSQEAFALADTLATDEAAIAFTSGSTGIPKGVLYRHGMFRAQIGLLRDVLAIAPGEVDLALLYIFALFNPALGVTTIIPDMDPTKSAEINPAYVVESVLTHGVTNAFGSPTIWKIVAPYCKENDIHLPSLKRVIMAGAPVPPGLIRAMYDDVLSPDAQVITPYGATEAMPLTMIDGHEILAETAEHSSEGAGMCVGTPVPSVTIKVIKTTDLAITQWDNELVVPQGVIGELVVKGPMVTRSYVNRPEQTALAKIADGKDVWHRMGDLGYYDELGRLWFCGRKAHRVISPSLTLYPVMCESIFNHHPQVHRTAVVGLGEPGQQRSILIVEPLDGEYPKSPVDQQRFTMELLALGTENEMTRAVQDVLFYRGVFPTDVRHNVKIQREQLADWAAGILKYPVRTRRTATTISPESDVTYASKAKRTKRTRRLLGFAGLLSGIVATLLIFTKRKRGKHS